jgi:N-hydroxyarylamine O-acetyltransferase
MSFDLDAYAARIRLPLVPAQDAEGLTVVQRAHRLAIPFENLDVLLGRGVSLDPDDVFAKLVTGNRGGFCFEQNQLLDRALAAFGFTARPLLARVWLFAGDEVPPRTHTLLLVDLDGDQWIADAGFGGGYAPPMRLADQEEAQGHDGVSHRLVADPDHGWMLYRRGPAGDWQPQYSFTTERTFDSDLALSSHWAATAPESRNLAPCAPPAP